MEQKIFHFCEMKKDDLEFLLEVRNECRHFLHDNREFNIQECKEWFKNAKPLFYLIFLEDVKIGYVRLSNYRKSKMTIYVGLDLHRKYRGKGFSKEIYRELFAFLRERFFIRTVFLEVLSHNDIARKIYKDLGFEDLYTKKSYCRRNGALVDNIYMKMKI